MNRTQTAWTIQRPDQVIVTSMIRATRQETIDLYRDHMIAYQFGDAWLTAYRRGFRAVKVAVAVANPIAKPDEP